ncbi:MAG: zinc dependent phospholipase C family protein, partial [Nitrospinota bacterium]
MILKISFVFSIVSCGVLLTPENAFAWGVGLHITQGTYILKHLSLIAPNIVVILEAFPYDYLYGCISADIFIGKGVKKRWDHCHNWTLAKKMLLRADSNCTTAFVYGYLSHLAADIISHNFYV